eukprot:scaffold37091_cov191-Amphora_coffeaeformis.AAC.1
MKRSLVGLSARRHQNGSQRSLSHKTESKPSPGQYPTEGTLSEELTVSSSNSDAEQPAPSMAFVPQRSPAPLPRLVFEIQEWHAVLADKHCGNKNRTTAATKVLKDVKQEYKESHAGKAGTLWYTAAYAEYQRRVIALFPDVPVEDCGLILVQRTTKVMESGRIMEGGKKYGYAGREAIYGPACNPKAVNFFFQSRDSPTLENE